MAGQDTVRIEASNSDITRRSGFGAIRVAMLPVGEARGEVLGDPRHGHRPVRPDEAVPDALGPSSAARCMAEISATSTTRSRYPAPSGPCRRGCVRSAPARCRNSVHRFAQNQRRVDRGQLHLGVLGHEIPGRAFCQRLGLVVGVDFGCAVSDQSSSVKAPAWPSLRSRRPTRSGRRVSRPPPAWRFSARSVPSTAGLDDLVLVLRLGHREGRRGVKQARPHPSIASVQPSSRPRSSSTKLSRSKRRGVAQPGAERVADLIGAGLAAEGAAHGVTGLSRSRAMRLAMKPVIPVRTTSLAHGRSPHVMLAMLTYGLPLTKSRKCRHEKSRPQ
jgi:hypothetical protein